MKEKSGKRTATNISNSLCVSLKNSVHTYPHFSFLFIDILSIYKHSIKLTDLHRSFDPCSHKCFQPGAILLPQMQLAMSGNIFDCHNWDWEPLASSG